MFLVHFVNGKGEIQKRERYQYQLQKDESISEAFLKVVEVEKELRETKVEGRKFPGVLPLTVGYMYKTVVTVEDGKILNEASHKLQVVKKPKENKSERMEELDKVNLIPVYVSAGDYPCNPVVREVTVHRGASVEDVLTVAFNKGFIPKVPEHSVKRRCPKDGQEEPALLNDIVRPENVYIPF